MSEPDSSVTKFKTSMVLQDLRPSLMILSLTPKIQVQTFWVQVVPVDGLQNSLKSVQDSNHFQNTHHIIWRLVSHTVCIEFKLIPSCWLHYLPYNLEKKVVYTHGQHTTGVRLGLGLGTGIEFRLDRISVRVSWRRGVVVSVVRRMYEVTLRRTRLVLGWVTVFGRAYHHGRNQPTRLTQPCIPPG